MDSEARLLICERRVAALSLATLALTVFVAARRCINSLQAPERNRRHLRSAHRRSLSLILKASSACESVVNYRTPLLGNPAART